MNWIKLKVRGLNWNGQNLEDWIELWPNLEGVTCNLALILRQKFFYLDDAMLRQYCSLIGSRM